MKCVARRRCQAKVQSRIVTFARGQVQEFDECPPHFEVIEGDKAPVIDFIKAGRPELMAAKWTFEDANSAMLQMYGKQLKKEEGTKKSEIVEQIIDIRYRAVNPTDIDHTR